MKFTVLYIIISNYSYIFESNIYNNNNNNNNN